MKITNKAGEQFDVTISLIPALEGKDLEKRYPDFASASDSFLIRQYLIEVLSYASVTVPDVGHIALDNQATINKYCGNWKDVDDIFSEVLRLNGIDRDSWREEVLSPWANVGAELAVAFVRDVAALITPALSITADNLAEDAARNDPENKSKDGE